MIINRNGRGQKQSTELGRRGEDKENKGEELGEGDTRNKTE
jgi:hypothetical protein